MGLECLQERGDLRTGKRFDRRPERRFYFKLALNLGKTVRQLLREIDSEELSEWYAYDQRWPLPDHWQQTARVCRIVMAASGNYKKHDIPDESAFMPVAKHRAQGEQEMIAEFKKLQGL